MKYTRGPAEYFGRWSSCRIRLLPDPFVSPLSSCQSWSWLRTQGSSRCTVRQCDIRRQPILPCQVQRSASRSLRIMIKHIPAMLSRTRRHAGIKSCGLQVSGEVSACSSMLRASAIVTTFSSILTDKCHLSRVLDQHRMLLKQLLHLQQIQ